MPIDYSDYHPKWTLIRQLILKRAANKCERCSAPNGKVITRLDGQPILVSDTLQSFTWDQIKDYNERFLIPYNQPRITRIVLTIAHVDQDKTNNKFDNLEALCQACHLHHDRHQHARNRKYGRYHKRYQLPLFC